MIPDTVMQQAQGEKWKYFEEPIALQSFAYQNLSEVVIDFSKAIPKQTMAKKAKLLLFLRTGNEQKTTFWTRTRLINGD